jgi:hypothetical protein
MNWIVLVLLSVVTHHEAPERNLFKTSEAVWPVVREKWPNLISEPLSPAPVPNLLCHTVAGGTVFPRCGAIDICGFIRNLRCLATVQSHGTGLA